MPAKGAQLTMLDCESLYTGACLDSTKVGACSRENDYSALK